MPDSDETRDFSGDDSVDSRKFNNFGEECKIDESAPFTSSLSHEAPVFQPSFLQKTLGRSQSAKIDDNEEEGKDKEEGWCDYECYIVLEVGDWAVLRLPESAMPTYWNRRTESFHDDMPDVLAHAPLNFEALFRITPPVQNIIHRHSSLVDDDDVEDDLPSEKQVGYLRALCRKLCMPDVTELDREVVKSRIRTEERIEDLRREWQKAGKVKGRKKKRKKKPAEENGTEPVEEKLGDID